MLKLSRANRELLTNWCQRLSEIKRFNTIEELKEDKDFYEYISTIYSDEALDTLFIPVMKQNILPVPSFELNMMGKSHIPNLEMIQKYGYAQVLSVDTVYTYILIKFNAKKEEYN